MKYYVSSDNLKSVSTTTYTKTGKEVYLQLKSGIGFVENIVQSETLEIEELSSIFELYRIFEISTSPITTTTQLLNTTSTTTTTSVPEVIIENINASTYTRAIKVNNFEAKNYFTNATSYAKYVKDYLNKSITFNPANFFQGSFYIQNDEKKVLDFSEILYSAILFEFELPFIKIGSYTNFALSTYNKRIGSIIVSKYDKEIIFKANSPVSSFLTIEKNGQYFSNTSEMAGISFNISKSAKEKAKIKYFVFDAVFSDLTIDVLTINDYYEKLKKTTSTQENYSNVVTTTFDITKTYQKSTLSINTTPTHFTVTTYTK